MSNISSFNFSDGIKNQLLKIKFDVLHNCIIQFLRWDLIRSSFRFWVACCLFVFDWLTLSKLFSFFLKNPTHGLHWAQLFQQRLVRNTFDACAPPPPSPSRHKVHDYCTNCSRECKMSEQETHHHSLQKLPPVPGPPPQKTFLYTRLWITNSPLKKFQHGFHLDL